jgi:hypothetical protein
MTKLAYYGHGSLKRHGTAGINIPWLNAREMNMCIPAKQKHLKPNNRMNNNPKMLITVA